MDVSKPTVINQLFTGGIEYKKCSPNKTSRNSTFFYERKGKFYNCNRNKK